MRFEDMEVWKKSARLATEVFRQTMDLKHWGFKDQITRSALSISSNIAEGAERNSSKELVYFLGIAKGSCGELRSKQSLEESWVLLTGNEERKSLK